MMLLGILVLVLIVPQLFGPTDNTPPAVQPPPDVPPVVPPTAPPAVTAAVSVDIASLVSSSTQLSAQSFGFSQATILEINFINGGTPNENGIAPLFGNLRNIRVKPVDPSTANISATTASSFGNPTVEAETGGSILVSNFTLYNESQKLTLTLSPDGVSSVTIAVNVV